MAFTTTSLLIGKVVAMSPRVMRGSGCTLALQGKVRPGGERSARILGPDQRQEASLQAAARHASHPPSWHDTPLTECLQSSSGKQRVRQGSWL